MLLSSRSSFTPVAVTVWAMFQLAAVKMSVAGLTLPSVGSLLLRPIVTFAVGWLSNLTVKVAVPPASLVSPLIADTLMPAVSSSRLMAGTSAAFIVLYLVSPLVAGAKIIV